MTRCARCNAKLTTATRGKLCDICRTILRDERPAGHPDAQLRFDTVSATGGTPSDGIDRGVMRKTHWVRI
jgi:hypothetical protein